MGEADQEEPMQRPTGAGERIFVSVRLRPLNEKEIAKNDVSDWECINDNTILYRNNLSVSERCMYPTAYTFDMVFGPDCSTRQVYEQGAKEVALSGVRGINSSVFAYGQTSSGKTYTMSGITEYTVADIYDYIERHQDREFVLKFSAMEIYNESVRDLLSTDTSPLRLLDDPERGTVVEKLSVETLRDWNHFKELLSLCEAQRQIGETSLNETSSRSHQILRLTIESCSREFSGNDKYSTLTATVNFVDLAGSERASQSLSAGMRLKEGCHINRSLLTLGTVIRKLSKGRSGHIPFRDSKLTRILQSSLGGNARTAIICTMSPARIHVEQTRNTLLFASCAKEVTTNAQVNVVMSDRALVKQLQRELARLESELKSRGLNSVESDSTALLREKDLQIEKLMNEVAELTRQLHLARTQVENVLEAAKEERISTIWADQDQHYPKLRVHYSWRTETSSSSSPVSEDPHSTDVGVRSIGASRCSDGQSSSSSDGHFILFPDFEENFVEAIPPPDPSIITTDVVGNNHHDEASEEQTHENSDDLCKEVRCIEVEELSRNRYSNSTMLESSSNRYANSTLIEFIPNTYVESTTPSPIMRRHNSELKEVQKEERANKETCSTKCEESNDLHPAFVIPSPEKPSPWLLDEGMSVSRSLKLIKSRSCRARLMDHLPTFWFEEAENIENTPPIEFDKTFIGRPEDYQRKHFALKYGFDIDSKPKDITQTCVGDTFGDDLKGQSIETSTDWVDPRVSDSNAAAISMEDQLVQETKANSPALSARDVKDVGLDPIQDDVESTPKWPSEFKRLQKEVIELWDACNISLLHRTYFYFLFKGDPADSFYMEVELRRLSFLKQTFSQGNKAMVDGRIVTATSSKRALVHERRMLSKYMQKRLSGEERDNLFLKWGIALSSSHRRLQLAHRLWTKTTDMDHIIESATLVAKLVGFEEEAQALKEMFGLLNFTPKCRKKSSIWKRTLAFL